MLKITSNYFHIFSTVDANTLWVHLLFVFLFLTLSNSLIYYLYTHSGSLHSVLSCQDFWENHSSALQRVKPAETCTMTLAEGDTRLFSWKVPKLWRGILPQRNQNGCGTYAVQRLRQPLLLVLPRVPVSCYPSLRLNHFSHYVAAYPAFWR